MKKICIICVLLCILLLAGCVKSAPKEKFNPGCEKLSEMSDAKVIEFIDHYEIDISILKTPNVDWIGYVRSVIVGTESNPNNGYFGGMPDMEKLFYSIVNAVNDYYGVKSNK